MRASPKMALDIVEFMDFVFDIHLEAPDEMGMRKRSR